ncbi:LEA type 2 family protein [Porticoccus sp. GXU_MW_L64]
MAAATLLRKVLSQAVVLLAVMLLTGCASLTPGFQNPEVNLVAVAPVSSSSLLEQRFKVGLRVLNPNSVPLPVKGLSYSLKLNGYKVVSGATGDIPELPAYGDVRLDLEAGVNLLGGARFLSGILNNPHQQLDYQLETRLDVGLLLPAITLVEEGQISLQQ